MRIPLVFGTDFIFKLALGVSGVFFLRSHRHVFPHLDSIACFLALRYDCIFSRAWSQLHVS